MTNKFKTKDLYVLKGGITIFSVDFSLISVLNYI